MIGRPVWIDSLEEYWKSRNIVWLSGVRRVGKTTLAKMLEDIEFINCDLPSDAERLSNIELFFDSFPRDQRLVLDEIHRLEDPSLVLKIAADAYPHLKVVATGSSTLAATKKFRDSLTGRKHNLYLSPVLWTECLAGFGETNLDQRLQRGGLPDVLLGNIAEQHFFPEWIDSFYARDIQELFSIRLRSGFLKLFRLLLVQSGGIVNVTGLTKNSGLTRPTVMAYLEAMTIAHAFYLLHPFAGGNPREIVKQPKVYAVDTGLVCHARGWSSLRPEDRGLLWEHLVLDELRFTLPGKQIRFWRDKSGRELDFVIPGADRRVDVVECKLSPDHFDPKSLSVFRQHYSKGNNYVVCPGVKKEYQKKMADLIVSFLPLGLLGQHLA